MADLDRMVIAHLRSLSAEGLIELLREARVCVGWEDYDEEGAQIDDDDEDAIYTAHLHNLAHRSVATCQQDARAPLWHWLNPTPDGTPGPRGTAPDLASARRAAEDAAIAAGYRVPWRDHA